MKYPNGATGTFITCTHDALGTDRLEIHGDNGKIIITDSKSVVVKKMDKPEDVWNHELDFRQMLALVKGQTQQKLYTEETFECPENWDQQHIDVLINFTNAIAKGEQLIAPGAEGIKAVEIANSMFLSDWLGHSVTLPVDDDLFYEKTSGKGEGGERKQMRTVIIGLGTVSRTHRKALALMDDVELVAVQM